MPKSAKHILNTNSVRVWLKQFDPSDRDAAKFLLSNLRFVSHTVFESGIKRMIRKAGTTAGPIALFAVRPLGSGERYFPRETSLSIRQAGLLLCLKRLLDWLSMWILSKKLFRKTITRSVAVKLRSISGKLARTPGCYQKLCNLRPSRTVPNEEVGSEGRLANLIRNMALAHPEKFLDHPSRTEMRARRCPKILLIDDMLSTSGRLDRFITHLKQERWLWSWRSLGWIKIDIVVYSATSDGEAIIRHKHRSFIQNIYVQVQPQLGVQWWTQSQRYSIERLCKKYAKKAKISKFIFGHRGGFGTILFESGCTSISPPILWEKTATWNPLFPDRKLPNDIIHELTSTEKRRKASVGINDELVVESPAASLSSIAFLVATQAEFYVLQAASRHYRLVSSAAAWTGLEHETYLAAKARCRELNLLDEQGGLTELGRQELKRIRRANKAGVIVLRSEKESLPLAVGSFYFPSRLRRTKGSSSGFTNSSGPTGFPDGSVATLANKPQR